MMCARSARCGEGAVRRVSCCVVVCCAAHACSLFVKHARGVRIVERSLWKAEIVIWSSVQ